MTTTLEQALDLARKGFHVFPAAPDGKTPVIDDFPNRASRDPEQIKKWWIDPVLGIEQPYNIGISTTRFGESEALLVVDVDNKGAKKGDEEIIRLELEGRELPPTFEQSTPTGGRHLFYRVTEPVKQGVSVLGAGLDIRSRGGYVIGVGSSIAGRPYTAIDRDLKPAPDWLVSSCGRVAESKPAKKSKKQARVDKAFAKNRAIHYLKNEAPISVQGAGGDQVAFAVAARIKDFGLNEVECVFLMDEHWNDRCEPPWSPDELVRKVENAYEYGSEPVGVASPEADFAPALPEPENKTVHPFDELNKEYAFVMTGGGSHILWETTDHRGLPTVEHLDVATFHLKLAANKLQAGERTQPVSKLWMQWPGRRSFDGFCFMPGKTAPERFYNLWKGFAVEPFLDADVVPKIASESLDMFLEHAFINVCEGDPLLNQWLLGYFAHLVQRPWEKPLVALVFRGNKGTGKNALVERVGHLLGNHFLLTSNRRYLVGNFNGHLENLLLFALDEAFWSGDKQAEGTLKDLITGSTHVIEHKGKEPYSVANCTRIVIIGNEDWLVPATQDERRFAVFNVGDGRRQDRSFFQTMRQGMERGGYRLLLRYLLDFDISAIDVNAAPSTEGLLEQKISSLDPFHQWWLDCLINGRITYADFSDSWPEILDKSTVREAFFRYYRNRNIRARLPEERALGKLFHRCAPSVVTTQKRRDGDKTIPVYKLPPLEGARKDWERFIGHMVRWE